MDKRTPFRASFIAAAVASLAGFAAAQGYVSDTRGGPVISSTGECVSSSTTASRDCGPGLIAEPVAAAPAGPGAQSSLSDTTERADIAAMTPGETMAVPAASGGYTMDSRGEVVRSDTGDCVMTDTSGAPIGIAECGGPVVAQAPLPVAPPVAEAPREAPLSRVTLDADTTFAFDSAELTDAGKDQLNDIVEAGEGEQVERLRVHITGYADRIGTEDYNLSLSEERAQAVRDYLVDAGLSAEVITAEGKGEQNPLVQCEGMMGDELISCLEPNRRSEVEFAALERAEESMPAESAPSTEGQPWAPGTDTGTPR